MPTSSDTLRPAALSYDVGALRRRQAGLSQKERRAALFIRLAHSIHFSPRLGSRCSDPPGPSGLAVKYTDNNRNKKGLGLLSTVPSALQVGAPQTSSSGHSARPAGHSHCQLPGHALHLPTFDAGRDVAGKAMKLPSLPLSFVPCRTTGCRGSSPRLPHSFSQRPCVRLWQSSDKMIVMLINGGSSDMSVQKGESMCVHTGACAKATQCVRH